VSDLQRTVNRNLLRHTVGSVMFCPVAPRAGAKACGRALDAKSAVAVWRDNRLVAIGCPGCLEPILASLEPEALEALEILRGRELS